MLMVRARASVRSAQSSLLLPRVRAPRSLLSASERLTRAVNLASLWAMATETVLSAARRKGS
jgi:hypothetical protein